MSSRIIFLSLALTGLAFAQSPSPLKLLLVQGLVHQKQQDGKIAETYSPAPASVKPGDLLRQTVTATNSGKSVLRDTTITVPVPGGTGYAGRATAAASRWKVLFSANGGKTFGAEPLKEVVTVTENGKSVQREVTIATSRYTSVRWIVTGMTPDESLNFSFDVKVK